MPEGTGLSSSQANLTSSHVRPEKPKRVPFQFLMQPLNGPTTPMSVASVKAEIEAELEAQKKYELEVYLRGARAATKNELHDEIAKLEATIQDLQLQFVSELELKEKLKMGFHNPPTGAIEIARLPTD